MALNLGHSMWNSTKEYLPSTTPPFAESLESTCTSHVVEYQIKNEHIRNYFSVPDPIDIIQKCQFNLLGKFARMDPTRLPRKFLTAWVSHPQCSGGQHYTLRNSYVETLQHILPNIPDNGTIDSWLPLG
jgi:hypothetical protein